MFRLRTLLYFYNVLASRFQDVASEPFGPFGVFLTSGMHAQAHTMRISRTQGFGLNIEYVQHMCLGIVSIITSLFDINFLFLIIHYFNKYFPTFNN